MRLIYRGLFVIGFFTFFLLLPLFAKHLTDGFRVEKMRVAWPCHPEWEFEPRSEVAAILNQPFSYLAKGAQAYVFVSQDGKYVVKFFRYRPCSFFKNSRFKRSKILNLFNACSLAFRELPEETGLICLHLNQTTGKFPTLSCTDKVGRVYRLSLDNYRFAIQKKAEPFFESLTGISPIQKKKRIDSFCHLLQMRVEKKIENKDPNVSRNFAFLGDQAIEIDFGNYRFQPLLDVSLEKRFFVDKLRKWLLQNDPEWVAYLDEKI